MQVESKRDNRVFFIYLKNDVWEKMTLGESMENKW